MTRLTTGRRLDGQAHPVEGTGFDYDSVGRLAELLAQRVSPLYSQPVTGEWVCGLMLGRDTGGQSERGLGIFTPGNAGPAEHIHPSYAEHFDLVAGEFVFKIAGQERPARAGEQLVVPPGTPHTFRCVGAQPGVAVVETWPAARTGEVIATLFGLAHEGALTPAGQPQLLQAMVIGAEYADDTVFTNPPPGIAIPVARALAPLGRWLGYRAIYPRFLEEAFWAARVEQPPRTPAG